MPSYSLLEKINERVCNSNEATFIASDFLDLSENPFQVYGVLGVLVKQEKLAKIGLGVYVRTYKSKITGKIFLEDSLRDAAITALKKKGIEVFPSSYERAYNSGQSTQIPTGLVLGVKSEVNSRISYKGKSIMYELLET